MGRGDGGSDFPGEAGAESSCLRVYMSTACGPTDSEGVDVDT